MKCNSVSICSGKYVSPKVKCIDIRMNQSIMTISQGIGIGEDITEHPDD